jgi:hypothetical protein
MYQKSNCCSMADPLVNFDVLLRSKGTGHVPTTENIANFRPEPEAVHKCSRWLRARGVKVHPTTFSLACSAPVAVFESLFEVKLAAIAPVPGRPPWRVDGVIRVPKEIAAFIEDVVLTPNPELF